METRDGQPDDGSHYRFRVSLRVRHPTADPRRITAALGMTPRRAWQAGEGRQTPTGSPLPGTYPSTYWSADVAKGQYPGRELEAGLSEVFGSLRKHRDFLATIRSEGACVELFVGWFFDRQSGGVISYKTLAAAGDLKIDLSFDVYAATASDDG